MLIHGFRAVAVVVLAAFTLAVSSSEPVPQWKDLFNGKDLSGWVDVNTSPETWSVRDGMIINTGKPIGVMRSDKEYENFLLHIEWRHMEPGGNSGVFAWSSAVPGEKNRLPDGVEIQMLDPAWVELHRKPDGELPPVAYVHGELFGVGGVQIVPDNPRGVRSKSVENRVLDNQQWNTYDVVAVDGTIKLAVNGKFVNGIAKSTKRKGYLCLEAEGAEIHFRNIKLMELPPSSEAAMAPTPAQ
jgi:hypothetical protein